MEGTLLLESLNWKKSLFISRVSFFLCFYFRAAAYTQLGDYEKCIQDCEMAISVDPTYAKAYNRLG
jgi:tetratricopeptide (TPR) repeat protein